MVWLAWCYHKRDWNSWHVGVALMSHFVIVTTRTDYYSTAWLRALAQARRQIVCKMLRYGDLHGTAPKQAARAGKKRQHGNKLLEKVQCMHNTVCTSAIMHALSMSDSFLFSLDRNGSYSACCEDINSSD